MQDKCSISMKDLRSRIEAGSVMPQSMKNMEIRPWKLAQTTTYCCIAEDEDWHTQPAQSGAKPAYRDCYYLYTNRQSESSSFAI